MAVKEEKKPAAKVKSGKSVAKTTAPKKRVVQKAAETKKAVTVDKSQPRMAEKRLRIKLKRSLIGRPQKQREVVKGLGLRRVNSEVIRKDCPEVWGMVRKVPHLVSVKEMDKK